MPDQWQRIVELFIMPPGGIIALLLLCLLLVHNMRFLLFIATASLYILSTPLASYYLYNQLETYPAIAPTLLQTQNAKSILVLSASQRHKQSEYGGDTLNDFSIARLRYAAFIHHHTGLPIIVSGGQMKNDRRPLAQLMAETLHDEYKIDSQSILIEDKSKTTEQNLDNSSLIAKQYGLQPSLLVTHAWHMPRAILSAHNANMDVIPAPTAFTAPYLFDSYQDWLPTAKNFYINYFALHEIVGGWWYQLKQIANS